MRLVVAALMAVIVGIVHMTPASAFYTSRGAGAASGLAASVPLATQLLAVQSGEGIVHVSWSEASTSLAVSHRVERSSTTGTVVACTTTSTSCDDTVIVAGTYTYRVITTFRTWTKTSTTSPPVTVVDHIPTATSFARDDPASTNLATVAWRITFSEAVTGLSMANLALTASGITGAALTSVSGSGTTWTVTATTGTGSGTLGASLTSSTGVTDATGNAVTVPVTGETYAIRPFFPTAFTLTDGGSNNRLDTGDTITLAFSTAIDQSTLCAAWTTAGDHSSASATVTLLDGGTANDSLAFALTACPTLHLGTIALGSTGYVAGGSATFTATLTVTVATRTVTITVGTRSGSGVIGSVGSAPTATFTPDPLLTATSGAAATGTVASTGRF